MLILSEIINKDNKDCLLIYDHIMNCYNECEKSKSTSINLVLVFFHDIMKILTSFFLKKNELDGPLPPKKAIIDHRLYKVPYIDYLDIQTGIDIDSKDFTFIKSKDKIRIIFDKVLSFVRKLIFSPNYIIGFRGVKGLENGELLKIGKNRYLMKSIDPQKIHIEDFDKQIEQLFNCIHRICLQLESSEYFDKIFDVVRTHICACIDDNKKNTRLHCDLLIASTMLSIRNRILASHATEEGIEVITLSHGEGDQLLTDEPKIGYGEKSLTDYFIGYGIGGIDSTKDKLYSNSLNENLNYICSNSDAILSIYSGEKIKPIQSLRKSKWMYVTNSLQYHNRGGPFCNIQDNIYLHWQAILIDAFPNLIYKRHPKGYVLYRQMSTLNLLKQINLNRINNIQILEEDFKQVYNNCDGYLFDVVASSFMLACATDKPIIYFNIGKRNLSSEAENLIKLRCIWIDIDPMEDIDLIGSLRPLKDKKCIDEITLRFSLEDHRSKNLRIDSIHSTINKILSKI